MDGIINWFMRVFGTMFRFTGQRYKRRFMAKIRGKTIGKLQAKSLKAQRKLDTRMNKAQDRLLDGKKPKKKKLPK